MSVSVEARDAALDALLSNPTEYPIERGALPFSLDLFQPGPEVRCDADAYSL